MGMNISSFPKTGGLLSELLSSCCSRIEQNCWAEQMMDIRLQGADQTHVVVSFVNVPEKNKLSVSSVNFILFICSQKERVVFKIANTQLFQVANV